ncbi:MAG: glycosyl transferase family 1 [Bacteroidetes bacterium]|nr:MAG: glycosyl transferase family 1 [Bacteroidota bacterium]
MEMGIPVAGSPRYSKPNIGRRMLYKFKYHLRERGLLGTLERFVNCWQVNGFSYTVRQMFKRVDGNFLISHQSQKGTLRAKTVQRKSENAYLADTRSQDSYYTKYKKEPVEVRMLDLQNILKKEKSCKGIVLYPLSYDLSIKQRPEHLLKALAEEGYLCLMMQIAESHERSKVKKLSTRLYVVDLFEECLTYFQDKKPIIYISYPFYKYLTKYFEDAYFIYDVLDNLKIFSNYCQAMEEDNDFLLSYSDLTLYSSQTLYEHRNAPDRNALLIENGVWVQDFEMSQDDVPREYYLKRHRPAGNAIGYHGAISELLDLDLIEEVLKLDNDDIYMIGPIATFSPSKAAELKSKVNRLTKYRNFHLMGFMSYGHLKYYIHQFDFCIIPFIVNEATDAVSPLKLFEYFACKKPVVATPTKTLLKYKDAINIFAKVDFVRFFASSPTPTIEESKYERLSFNNRWETLVAPIVSRLNRRMDTLQSAPVPVKKRMVDIINVNFFDWDGEVLFKGGAERYVYDLAKICAAKGLHVRILQNATSFFLRNYNNIPIVGLTLNRSFDLDKISEKYNTYCRQSDLVIASPLDLACNLHYSCNSIGINHGIYWDDRTTRLTSYDIHHYNRIFRALKTCSKSICVDTNFINWLRTYDYELALKCEYVPNYVCEKQFTAVEKDFDGNLTIIYPRRLYEARGLYVAIEAFTYLLPKYPDFHLHFVGQADGDDVVATRNFINKFKSQVFWYELDMEKMVEAYHQSHIAIIPTAFAEGTSLSCLEAMATNNGIVATNIGGLPNLIINKFNGMLINPDANDLINAVERLINDRKLLKTLASNALLTVNSFRKDQWDQKWNSIIEESLCSL